MTPSADESVKILTQKLKVHEPFVFTKFGDGDLYWMSGNPVPIAGGETHRPGIEIELHQAAQTLSELPHAYFGDQLACGSGPYLHDEQRAFIRPRYYPRWLHFECLLIHRLSPELLEFYRTLKELELREDIGFIGGPHLVDAIEFPFMSWKESVGQCDAHAHWETAAAHAEDVPWSILLLSAGRASKMIASRLAPQFPDRTIIELGSALDPLFVGRTRSEQINPAEAREYFKELL